MLPAGPLLWCFWGGVTYIENMPPETPAKGVAMKVHIEMDMTPEEARCLHGPARCPAYAAENDGRDAGADEGGLRRQRPRGHDARLAALLYRDGGRGADTFQKFQKAMWDSATAMLKKDGK
jgi:hypothetical protein